MKKLLALLILICCLCTVSVTALASPGETESVVTPSEITLSMPVISYSVEPTNKGVTVTITTPDSLDESAKIMYKLGEESEWVTYTEPFMVTDNTVISAKVISGTNFQSPLASAEITNIDKLPPQPPTIIADTVTWVSSSLKISLTDGSDAESGFLRCEYKIGQNGEWVEYYGDFEVTDVCVVYARSVDRALNYSSELSLSIMNFDKTPPESSSLSVTFGNDSGANLFESSTFSMFFRDPVICTIEGGTDSQSGVGGYEYQLVSAGGSVDSSKWLKYNASSKPKISSDFIGFVYARAIDNSGNASLPVSSSGVVLDSTPPKISDIKKSTTIATGDKVKVSFSVNDNIAIDTVTVNDDYVGIYTPEFSAYRNGEYKIIATDKAGNSSTYIVLIDNIQTTPYNLLKIVDSLIEEDYTPTSWAALQIKVAELRNVLTVETSGALIDSAAEDLLSALEALVERGDGTLSRELIDRVTLLDKNGYTASSWANVEAKMSALNAVLADTESSQLDVDNARRDLETAITELVKLASFSSLDRIIEKAEGLEGSKYPNDKYQELLEAVEAAKALDRTDTSQEVCDSAYNRILDLMSALKISDEPEEDDEVNYVLILIIGVSAIAIGLIVTIVLVMKRGVTPPPTGRTGSDYEPPVSAQDDEEETQTFYYEASSRRGSPNRRSPSQPADKQFGDIHFGDEGEYSDWE